MSALDTVVERAALYGLRSTSDAMLEQAATELAALRERLARLEAERAAIQELAKQWRLAGAGRYQEQDGPTYTLLSALAGCADALADILKDQP